MRRVAMPLTSFSRPCIVRHELTDSRWTLPDLTLALLSDLHVCKPWTPISAIEQIVVATNRIGPDMVLLPGDFIVDRKMPARGEAAGSIVAVLERLRAPLGVAAVLGNHDWWDCGLSRQTGFRRNSVLEAFEKSSIPLLSNRAIRVPHAAGFWLVGLDSQVALRRLGHPGLHDPDSAFAGVNDDAPAILMAHEPDYFAEGDARAFLQISGHTHGGQLNLGGWRPLTPSRYRSRYGWGHIQETGRHLIVSGGIGYSGLPLRVLQPPEITLVTLRRGG